jgi:hypothetical protein
MTAYAPDGNDDNHDLAALFSGAGEHSDSDGAAWSVDAIYGDAPAEPVDSTAAWKAEESAVNAMYGDVPMELTDKSTDFDAIREAPPDDVNEEPAEDGSAKPFTVANPAGMVWVSAGIGGTTLRVELSPTVVHMTEVMLAEEICVLADLARLKGQAGQLTVLLEAGVAIADDGDLATGEQAAAAQAEVFATRYGSDT